MVTDEVRLSYLKWMAKEDQDEAKEVNRLRDYYNGKQPVHISKRQKEFIGVNGDYEFVDNYCDLIVNIQAERLRVHSVSQEGSGNDVANRVWQWWVDNKFTSIQDDLYTAAMRDKEAYLIVSFDNNAGIPRWTMNLKSHYETDGMHLGVKLHRHPDTGEPTFASKRWVATDPLDPTAKPKQMKVLYFPDRVEKYTTPGKFSQKMWREAGWEPFVETDENGNELEWPTPWVDAQGEPLGLPVIPFTNPGGKSEITNSIMAIQDMINKSDIDLIAAADISGFPLPYVSGVDPGTKITFSPAHLIQIPDASGKVGRVEAGDLAGMIDVCSFYQQALGSKSRIPLYLLQKWGATPPSGESLKSQEAGLIAKVQRKQNDFGNSWSQVFDLSLRLYSAFGQENNTPVGDGVRVNPNWESPYTRSMAEIREEADTKKAHGVDEETILIEVLGYPPADAKRFVRLNQTRRQQIIGQTVTGIINGSESDTSTPDESTA